MHDHGQPPRQRHDRLLHPAMPGDLHRPGFEPGPFRRTHQHALRRFVEHHPHHLVFSNRPSGSSTFRPSTNSSVDVAHGLALLFGLGTKALPSWDSKTRWNNLLGGLAVRRTVGPSGHANSPHPSSREAHHSTARWSPSVLLLD